MAAGERPAWAGAVTVAAGPVTVRPYEPRDRPAVFRLAADTAFFGEPLERYLDDRRLFCDLFYRYYTDLEADHAWVASAGDQPVGFLMGCVDTAAQRRLWVKKILPAVVVRLLRGQYTLGRRTWRYAGRLARGALVGEALRPDLRRYPAHLHLNLQSAWRGQGLGRRLSEAFLQQLCQLGVAGVHADTTSRNTAALHLYQKLGFQVVDERPSRQWAGLVSGPVRNLCYARALP